MPRAEAMSGPARRRKAVRVFAGQNLRSLSARRRRVSSSCYSRGKRRENRRSCKMQDTGAISRRVLHPRACQRGWSLSDPLGHVVGTLAGSKFDDTKIGEPVPAERIFLHDGFDLLATFSRSQDDSTDAWNLPPRDEKLAGGVVLLQESDVRLHVRVDFGEGNLIRELDDEHAVTEVTSSHFRPGWERFLTHLTRARVP